MGEGDYDLIYGNYDENYEDEPEHRPRTSWYERRATEQRLRKNKKRGSGLKVVLKQLEDNNGFRKCDHCKGWYKPDMRNILRGWGLCCSKSCAARRKRDLAWRGR